MRQERFLPPAAIARSLARSSGIDFLLADIVDWGRKTDGSMDQLSEGGGDYAVSH